METLAFKVALVYCHVNKPLGAHIGVGLIVLTMAEYFRDNEKVELLVIDNFFRLSTLLDRIPCRGSSTTLSTKVGSVQERISSIKEAFQILR